MGVKVDVSELKAWSEKIGSLGMQKELFYQEAVKDLAGRLLALVIPRTPVKTRALRLAWKTELAPGISFSSSGGGTYTIDVINPMKYASYVEFGHRQTPGRYVPAIGKRLKQSWVNGKFFLTLSEAELGYLAPNVLEAKLEAFLKKVF